LTEHEYLVKFHLVFNLHNTEFIVKYYVNQYSLKLQGTEKFVRDKRYNQSQMLKGPELKRVRDRKVLR